MPWLWITTGLILLMTTWVVNRFIHIRKAARTGYDMYFLRLRCSRKALRLIRRACRYSPLSPELEALKSCRKSLTGHIQRLRMHLRRTPPLPADHENRPRLMALAHDICDEGHFSANALLRAISHLSENKLTSVEVWSLPLCVAAAQSQRLTHVLSAIIADAKERTAAIGLYRRLQRAKQPSAVLDKVSLSSAGLAALYNYMLQQNDGHQADFLRSWLDQQELSAESLRRLALERQQQLISELHRALECFSDLEHADWLARCEEADPLHPLLQQDPSGTYTKLSATSRHQLRMQIARFSRRVGINEGTALQEALTLSQENHGNTPEGCILWYFQERTGMIRLHHALRLRKGWFWVRLQHCRDTLCYIFLLVYGILTGFVFLQARQPVFMLPFFALIAGCISRHCIQRLPRHTMPQMSHSLPSEDLHTLIFLHAVLPDPATCHAAVRQLHRAACIFPANTDFLLLGDFAPSITARSATDQDVLQAASEAITALEDSRFLYLHRCRVWDEKHHCYSTNGGQLGALLDLCRMITHGESGTSIAFSTQPPASLERRYAYLFMLGKDQLPTPGVLEGLLATMSHPLVNRIPTSAGWRGYSALSPEDMTYSDGLLLLRPTTLLEVTDGIATPAPYSAPLFAELGGHACVPGIRVNRPASNVSWADVYQKAFNSWKLFPWQLSHVQTPSGMIRNPLGFLSRFRLREHLRDTLTPLGRFGLLLWSVMTANVPLFLLALIAPELGMPIRGRQHLRMMFSHLILHPTSMIVNLLGAFDALFGIRRKAPDFASIEIWTQVLTATVFAALGFALPEGSLPPLMLAALFACFPLAHRQK